MQTVPDIQHEDTIIRMTPFPTLSFGLQTKSYGKSGFGLILKVLPLETKRLDEDQNGRFSNLEEQLAASETFGLTRLTEEPRNPRVLLIFQTILGLKDRMRSEQSHTRTSDPLPVGGGLDNLTAPGLWTSWSMEKETKQ